MTTPFTALSVTISGTTPTALASWQRSPAPFEVQVYTTDGNLAYLAASASATSAQAWLYTPPGIFSFTVPAADPWTTPATETLYAFATSATGAATVSVFVAPH